MNSNAHWTGIAAIVLSTLALGSFGWMVACNRLGPAASSASSLGTAGAMRADPPSAMSAAVTRAPIAEQNPGTAASTASVAPTASPQSSAEFKGKTVEAVVPTELRVKRLILAHGVSQRTPVDPGTQFSIGPQPIYAFVEVENASIQEGAIRITFEKDKTKTGNIELPIPGKPHGWRTWGWTRGVREAGQWAVVVRNAAGKELARSMFEVTS